MDHTAILAAIAPGASMEDTVAAIKPYKFGDSTTGLKAVEGLVTGSLGNADARKAVAATLVGVLTSADATRDAKIFACRQLAICGGAENVAALAPLLTAIDTSNMARIALERIPGGEADAALVDALAKADAKSQIGIVNSLGARRCAAAVPAIAPLAKSKDPLLADAAAAALGHIGGADAVKVLKRGVARSARATAANALLECKERG
ncbi:MAG: HEAT repeat domain-containing protein [Candidatus Hydrogenedentes bacterium]|nr:HEAT repeat domain-containing protein [Candidatus Hydrogenedentota bacterium]